MKKKDSALGAGYTEDSRKHRRAIYHLLEQIARRKTRILDLTATVESRDSQVAQLNTSLSDRHAEVHSLESHVHSLESHVHGLELHIHRVERSIPMQLAGRHQRIVAKIVPPGTRRRRPYDLALTGVRVILNEGWKSFFRVVRAHLRGDKGRGVGNDE